jgi:hypothetical protein
MMSSKSELVKVKQNEISKLDSAIKAEKDYLETIESLIQFAKETCMQARKDLEDAKTLVSNNIKREELCPSLKKDIRWNSIVLETQQNQEEKLQHYNGWEKNYTEKKAQYKEHSDRLREYEDKRQKIATQLLSLHLALSAEAEEPKHISDKELAEAKESFLKTEFSVPRP